jgi:methylglutaconyl-CoA hydratase
MQSTASCKILSDFNCRCHIRGFAEFATSIRRPTASISRTDGLPAGGCRGIGTATLSSKVDVSYDFAGMTRSSKQGPHAGEPTVGEFEMIDVTVDERGAARLVLNRPEAKNAMSQELMRELSTAARQLADDETVRVIVLSGAGDVFSAGGDLKGMKRQVANTREGRMADATEFAGILGELDTLAKPLIGRINGSAFGGGLGLISVCDIAIGLADATFRLSEVTLGLIPATISPFVVAKMGVPNARRIMLNAYKMNGHTAARLGLLDEVVSTVADLDAAVEREVAAALQCAPGAVANAKELIRFVSTHGDPENLSYTATALADSWESAEIREGIDAFFNKRKPNWQA